MATRDQYPVTASAEDEYGPRKLFDVTCTIGSVYEGQGDVTPYQAAFLLIARHDAEGQFRFPNDGPGETIVTVERIGTEPAEAGLHP